MGVCVWDGKGVYGRGGGSRLHGFLLSILVLSPAILLCPSVSRFLRVHSEARKSRMDMDSAGGEMICYETGERGRDDIFRDRMGLRE